jgi:hypothetical protein
MKFLQNVGRYFILVMNYCQKKLMSRLHIGIGNKPPTTKKALWIAIPRKIILQM